MSLLRYGVPWSFLCIHVAFKCDIGVRHAKKGFGIGLLLR
jgi:hypothetical protein